MDIDLRPILLAEDDPRDETLEYLRANAKTDDDPGLPAVQQ